jgi:hypothetical protein
MYRPYNKAIPFDNISNKVTQFPSTILILHTSVTKIVGGAYGTHGRGEKSLQGFGGKAGWKETTWKTKA